MNPYNQFSRLTRTELRSIVAAYHASFPTWKLIQRDTLAREDGPVVQGITFERLSGGEYRPTGYVHVLVVPADHWFLEMSQDLNVKLRQIDRRRDSPQVREQVVAAIRAEFLPSVERPLVAEEVLQLYEREANPPRSPQAYSLAALNAYLGHEGRASYWCQRFDELVTEGGGAWQDYDYERRAFLDKLQGWIEAGEAKPQLDRVLQEERRKWGLGS